MLVVRLFARVCTLLQCADFSFWGGVRRRGSCATISNLILNIASPRVYVSTNPWKITATIHTVSNTREDYVALLEKIRASAPADIDDKKKLSKSENHHVLLMKALEDRLEVIDNETLVSRFLHALDTFLFGWCVCGP